ncbi:ATPase AAA [Mycobacteroides abscessus subsp. abscessus]|nr:ATPase AAA [Mycobacteroides abscessus subsp. abscessus]
MHRTQAYTRAVLASAAFVLYGVLGSRLDALLVGCVLLAWIAVAHALRPRAITPATLEAAEAKVNEGESVTATARGARGMLVTVGARMKGGLEYSPRWAVTTDLETARVSAQARVWGTHEFGPFTVQETDALGAFRRHLRHEARKISAVAGATAKPRTLALTHVLGVSGPHASRTKGEGTALADIRPYRPGDRLNKINWRVTSRRGILHTNETFSERDTDVLIVVDTMADIRPIGAEPGDGRASSLDMSVEAATVLARHYLALGDRVGIHDAGALIGSIPFGTGERQMRRILEALSRLSREDAVSPRLRRVPRLRSGTLTIACTPLLSEEFIEQIGLMRAHGADLTIIDTLPAELTDTSRLTGTPMRRIDGLEDPHLWDEAWVIRGFERRFVIADLERRGIPVRTLEEAL